MADDATGEKVRLRFRKDGDLRLVSHLDLMRCAERMLRRADIPFKSTGGFHPTPRLMFALSLPLGVGGCDEVVEIELMRPMSAEEVRERLNRAAPAGLTFTSAKLVAMKASALPRRAEYRIALPSERVEETQRAAEALLAEAKVWVDKYHPRPRRVNVRPYVRGISFFLPSPLWGEGPGVRGEPSPFPASVSPEWAVHPSPLTPLPNEERGTRVIAGEEPGTPPDFPGDSCSPLDSLTPHPQPLSPVGRGEEEQATLLLDFWVTGQGTARAEDLLALLGVADLLEAGNILERTTLELHDETPDLTDGPPEGPPETARLDHAPAIVAGDEDDPATRATWGTSPDGPVVE